VGRAVVNSGHSDDPRVDERHMTVGIPGWAQSSRRTALHLVIEALTDLVAGSGGCFGARHPIL